MSTHFIFPKPRDWNTFEDIVADVFSRKYSSYNLQRYARSGQKQRGVDIVGPTQNGLLGIQCKHHPSSKIKTTEIDSEVAKSEKFTPSLTEYVIATSADRDEAAHKHVLQLSKAREAAGQYPVAIKFWEDIYEWLNEYPDLVYKHFTKYYPVQELENPTFPGLEQLNKRTLSWPATPDELYTATQESLAAISKVDPYQLTLGLSSFPNTSFTGLVDIEIQLADLFSSPDTAENNFIEAARILNELKTIISDPFFAKEIFVKLQARLTLSFLFGWIFRRVTGFNLNLISRTGEVWTTGNLPYVPSLLTDEMPILLNSESREVVLILNITRDASSSANAFVDSWPDKPLAVLGTSLHAHHIRSAAHALAIADDIGRKIKVINDRWGATKIHLFGAMPATLAALISYHLNAICPIVIYFMDQSQQKYRVGGTITTAL